MGRDEYGNKDLALLLIGAGSIILSFFVAILGVIAGLLGVIFAVKARKIHKTGMNAGALICSIIGMLLGIGSIVLMMSVYVFSYMA